MKRTIAAIVLLIGLGSGTLFAEDPYRRERDIRHDQAQIAQDRWELRRALSYGDYETAARLQRKLRREYRDLDKDYRHLHRDRDFDRDRERW
jgi:hypothetical protein